MLAKLLLLSLPLLSVAAPAQRRGGTDEDFLKTDMRLMLVYSDGELEAGKCFMAALLHPLEQKGVWNLLDNKGNPMYDNSMVNWTSASHFEGTYPASFDPDHQYSWFGNFNLEHKQIVNYDAAALGQDVPDPKSRSDPGDCKVNTTQNDTIARIDSLLCTVLCT
jgi:hypothetical protein